MNIEKKRLGRFCVLTILCILWGAAFFLHAPQAEALAKGGITQAEAYPQQISSARFAELAKTKVEQELKALGETRRYELKLVRAPQNMRLPKGEIICEVELPQKLKYTGVNPVHIRVFLNGKLYRRAVCYYEVAVFEKVLVLAHDMRMEQRVSPTDVRAEERRIEAGAGRYLTDYSQVKDRVATRVLKTGTILEQSLLQNPVVMESGAPITIIANYNGVQVKTEGIALQKGRMGATIRVKNAHSGRILRGRVIDTTLVEIL